MKKILLLSLALLPVGCASRLGNDLAGGSSGLGVGAVTSLATKGKLDLPTMLSSGVSGVVGSEITRAGMQKQIAEAQVTGIEIGEHKATRRTYEVIQQVHKNQQNAKARTVVVHQYEVPATKNPSINQVPHNEVIEIQKIQNARFE